MNTSCMSPVYEEGVKQFLEFSSERSWPDEEGKYLYTCINCLNGRWHVLDEIREYLLCDGVKKIYTTWIWHGELVDMQRESQPEPIDVEMKNQLEDMICDLGQESFRRIDVVFCTTTSVFLKTDVGFAYFTFFCLFLIIQHRFS